MKLRTGVNEAEGKREGAHWRIKRKGERKKEEKKASMRKKCDLFAKSGQDEWIMGSLMRKSV